MISIESKIFENVLMLKIKQGKEIPLGRGIFFNVGNFALSSSTHREMRPDTLYVKGTNDIDEDNYFSKSFNTEQDARCYLSKVENIIKEYNNSLIISDFIWTPEIGDKYFYPVLDDDIRGVIPEENNGYTLDEAVIGNFAAFKEKEYAERVNENMRLLNLLWQLKYKLCPNYEHLPGSTKSVYIEFDLDSRKFAVSISSKVWSNITPVFDEESAFKAVNFLNDNRQLWENLIP